MGLDEPGSLKDKCVPCPRHEPRQPVPQPLLASREVVRESPRSQWEPFRAQKDDLIAELKMSKDISGIKKLKVERAKDEQRQEKQLMVEIPARDAAGNPVPEWKRQMLAKKAAERARRELEARLQREAEEKRLQAIPAWKRQLMAKKEETKSTVVYTPRVDDKRGAAPRDESWHQQAQRGADAAPGGDGGAVNGTNGTCAANGEESNKENKTPAPAASAEAEDDNAPIIPWRAQLRKTNSKLSLVE
ncbi:Uncharacterized protein GBIM_16594 [Gryllus bimaculatus]|nr:Uncharacterized protein GBIM_16594 [Gryllus bimaculatus]